MQTNFRYILLSAFFAVALFASCKKDAETTEDSDVQIATHSDDQSRVSNEMDAVANDANVAVEGNVAFSGRVQTPLAAICDANIAVDITATTKKITITYDGSASCSAGRTRTGAVVLSMPVSTTWKNAGAILTVTYQNLKITRTSDNKSITINGTQTITNVSGGRLADLSTQDSIIHTLNSNNMAISFDDGTQRTWQVSRKRIFKYNNGIVINISGTHTEGSSSTVAEWGTSRFGSIFTTSITQPLIIRQDCNFRVTSGQIQHARLGTTSTVTFGLNATGDVTGCPGTGNYYYKLSWTGRTNESHTILLPY